MSYVFSDPRSIVYNGTHFAEYECAWFPAPQMYSIQLAYERYSHGSRNTIDIAPGGIVAIYEVFVSKHDETPKRPTKLGSGA